MVARKRILIFGLIFLAGCAAVAAEGRLARLQWMPLGAASAQATEPVSELETDEAGRINPGGSVTRPAAAEPAARPETTSAPKSSGGPVSGGERRDAVVLPVPRGKALTASPAPRPVASGLLDLNLATAAQLEALPGIGPSLARRIIEYRQQHGGFRTVGELDQVRGIGPSRLEALAPLLKVAAAGETH